MEPVYGFQLVRERTIAELNTKARLYRHVKTGAELLSLENDDTNKVFGITFRTPPADSTGLPHIMEHAVLCGSRKYPVKEPFVELMKGSLHTFLNAFTYPDKTCYPVASQNLQDFYNLVDVYLDAVFYPLIPPHVLEQEGWHFELESIDSQLNIKGVVFNEMKGAYSSPDAVLYKQSQESLYPDTAYGLDSGGDPTAIPNLTYEQFKSFHQTYYHPSNSLIYFYGDDDAEVRLRLLNEYLRDFDQLQVAADVALQAWFDRPRRLVVPYETGPDQEGRKALLTLNWLLSETDDAELVLGLTILEHILIATPASPLRKALIDSGLGEDLAGGGLETGLRQMNFSTGLKGVARQNVDQVEALILTTLDELASAGFDPDTIAAAVNTIEFRLRENNTGSFPRGLLLMLRALGTWLYHGDPMQPLAFEAPLGQIKHRLADGEQYFEGLVLAHFIRNPHRTTVILEPDAELGKRRQAAERSRLDQARASMNNAVLQAVIENTRTLKRIQETPDPPEALAMIPSLTLADLDKDIQKVPTEVLAAGPARLFYHDLFTNGIFYLDLGFDLHRLSQEHLPYVPLFGQALLEMGTQAEDFVRLTQRIGRSTGGISPSWFASMHRQAGQASAWLFLRSKATVGQVDELLAILREVLLTALLDNRERFKQIVLETKAGQEAQLTPMGHRLANRRLRAHFTPADWVIEQMDGASSLFFLRNLAEQVEQDWPGVLRILEEIRSRLIDQGSLVLNATVDRSNWQMMPARLEAFIGSLPCQPAMVQRWQPALYPQFEGLSIPAQVNYVAKGANLYDLGYQFSGSVDVITSHLRNTWLWDRVRLQGGAYGVFCLFDRHSGVLTFISYRDPNILETLDIYDQSAEFLSQLELSQAELTKSIIGVISDMDAYQLPDAKGYSAMIRSLLGVTDEERQSIRDAVLSTTQADFRDFAGVLEQVKARGQVVLLGSTEALTAVNADRDDWLQISKVL